MLLFNTLDKLRVRLRYPTFAFITNPIRTRCCSVLVCVCSFLCFFAICEEDTGPFHDSCFDEHADVIWQKELFITDESVISSQRARLNGTWHFRSALQRIIGSSGNFDAVVRKWFDTWKNTKTVDGSDEPVRTRPRVADILHEAFKSDRIRLIAIVNRIDLVRFNDKDPTQPDSLGEGRFIYELTNSEGRSLPFTLILEYSLPNVSEDMGESLRWWAQAWRNLGSKKLGDRGEFTERYLDALNSLTMLYSSFGRLNQIRTNEQVGPSPWEMREFQFDSVEGSFVLVPVKLTPMNAVGNSTLKQWVESNVDQINIGHHEMPPDIQAAIGHILVPNFTWTSRVQMENPDHERALFNFSIFTCNGCHAGDTKTPFQHIGASTQGKLSDFLACQDLNLPHELANREGEGLLYNEMLVRVRLLKQFSLEKVPLVIDGSLLKLLRTRVGRVH